MAGQGGDFGIGIPYEPKLPEPSEPKHGGQGTTGCCLFSTAGLIFLIIVVLAIIIYVLVGFLVYHWASPSP